MTDKPDMPPKPSKPHTELRRQGKAKPDREEGKTRLKPRTPADRLPGDGEDDDLFNDMPV